MDNRTIERLHSLQLLAESRDQGYSDDPSAGNWTWFEVGVYVDASASALKTKDGIDLSWKSHPNRFMSEEYDWVCLFSTISQVFVYERYLQSEGMVFDKTHEIFGVLSVRPFSKVIRAICSYNLPQAGQRNWGTALCPFPGLDYHGQKWVPCCRVRTKDRCVFVLMH